MTDLVVGVTAVAFSCDVERVRALQDAFPGIIHINDKKRRFTLDELVLFLQKCDYAIVGLDQITRAVLEQCPRLKVISKYGVGLDNIDFDACERFGVRVIFPKGVNKRSVTEEVLGAILSLMRNLYVTANLMKRGEWVVQGGRQLTGKTVGIIGVGHIGKDLIEILRPFGCKILVNDIIEQDEYYHRVGAMAVGKEDIFKNADVVTVHTPLNDETRHMIDERALALMKPTAILVNAARGGIVDESALKKALREKKLAGAALDVYEVEPLQDLELVQFDNLMCMPHIGGNAKEAIEAMGMAAIDNLMTAIGENDGNCR